MCYLKKTFVSYINKVYGFQSPLSFQHLLGFLNPVTKMLEAIFIELIFFFEKVCAGCYYLKTTFLVSLKNTHYKV